MFFKNWSCKDQNEKIAGKIKRDLILTFQKKGISVSKLNINTQFNRLNVEVCIKGE
jgi:hypothetical protein